MQILKIPKIINREDGPPFKKQRRIKTGNNRDFRLDKLIRAMEKTLIADFYDSQNVLLFNNKISTMIFFFAEKKKMLRVEFDCTQII